MEDISHTPPPDRGVTPPPSVGFSNPRELAFYCIGTLLDLCTQYRRTLDRVESTRLLNNAKASRHLGVALDPAFHVPSGKTLKWLTAAQLRLWNATKAMLLSCTYRERPERSFAHALGRSEAVQKRLRKLILGDVIREGDALWQFDGTELSLAEALEPFKDLEPGSVRWIEGAAMRQVKDEYAHKAKAMKKAFYKERREHLATKRKMLTNEIEGLSKLAEAYREVARLKEKYEFGFNPEDDYLQRQQIADALHQKQIHEAELPQTDSEAAVSEDGKPEPTADEPSLGRSLSRSKRKREQNSSGSETGTLASALRGASVGPDAEK